MIDETRALMDVVVPLASVGTGLGILGGTALYEIKRVISPDLVDQSEYFRNKRRYEAQTYGAVIGLASGAALGIYANGLKIKPRKRRKA